MNRHFLTNNDALSVFKDYPLEFKPGNKYLYTTHGYTLFSEILARAS